MNVPAGWQDHYSVGNISLDQQHQAIFALAHQLEVIIRSGNTWQQDEALHEALNKLYLHTVSHFKSEEALLEQYRYPHAELHADEHRAFLDQLNNAMIDAIDKRLTLPALLDMIRRWVDHHITGSDMDYARHFEQLGRA